MNNCRINFRHFSLAFWRQVHYATDDAVAQKDYTLRTIYNRCEEYRAKADYNTGSITFDMMRTLYALMLYFEPARVCEIGTFIGRSASVFALQAEVFTCDKDNDCFPGSDRIKTHPKQTSTAMLKLSSDPFDFFFFDGRIQRDDLPLIQQISNDMTVYCFDDFCGIEKGVANALILTKQFPHHILIEPEPDGQIALMINPNSVELTRQ